MTTPGPFQYFKIKTSSDIQSFLNEGVSDDYPFPIKSKEARYIGYIMGQFV